MGKYRAIPEGYMTVGEAAKKMGTTVRTLQYYDREGLLTPSAESEGGRRLYTDKDLIGLYQIMTLKSLGFSLEDIKERLISLDTPEDVAAVLTDQADVIRRKIEVLSKSLREVEMLKGEVLEMQSVNFKKYADIIMNLQMENESYQMIKNMDDETLEYFRSSMDKERAVTFIDVFNRLCDDIVRLQEEGIRPESENGQECAGKFWNMIMKFTGGDMGMLYKLMDAGQCRGTDQEGEQRQEKINAFIGPALDVYLEKKGIRLFEEEENV